DGDRRRRQPPTGREGPPATGPRLPDQDLVGGAVGQEADRTAGTDGTFDAAAGAVDPEAFAAFGLRQEDFARSLRAGRLSKAMAEKQFPDVTVSDTALHTEFDKRAAAPFRPWKAKIKVARFADQVSAEKLKERVAAG